MAIRNIQAEISKAVRKYLIAEGKIDAYDERVASLAHLDLLFGPLTLDDGTDDVDFKRLHEDRIVNAEAQLRFGDALHHLRDLDLPSDLYYDEDSGEVLEREPEGYEEDDEDTDHTLDDDCDVCGGVCEFDDDNKPKRWVEPTPYYHIEGKDILAAAFTQELVSYI